MPRKARGKKPIGRRQKRYWKAVDKTNQHAAAEYNYSDFFFTESDSLCDRPSLHQQTDEIVDNEGSWANEFYLVADKIIQYSPHSDVDTVYRGRMNLVNERRYSDVLCKLALQSTLIRTETNFILLNSNDIKFVELYDGDIPGVKCSVTIERNTYKANIYVHRQLLSSEHLIWNSLPSVFATVDDIILMLKTISQYGVCVGNPDTDFRVLEPGISAFHEPDFGAIAGNLLYCQTIRCVGCDYLVQGSRCRSCIEHRAALRKKRSLTNSTKPSDSVPIISRKTPHSKMTKGQLCEKVKALQSNRKEINSQILILRKKLQKAIELSEKQSESTNNDMMKIAQDCFTQVEADFPDQNSFQRLFWSEQVKFNKSKKSSGMRWHPMMIRWCLQIKSRSTKAYETMRELGFIKLPSSRTLFDYTHFMESKCGISPDIQQHLTAECTAKGMFDTSSKNFVGILFDEIKVKEGLVYNKHTGELIGFIDLDKTANQLLDLNREDNKSKVASHMLVIMVRGVATNLKYPLACYATDGITAPYLYTVVWQAIEVLEINVGLKVMFITCDGAASNRKFFAMHNDEFTHFTQNLYAPDRNIYFISDVPHLMKTTRNCFSNSFSHTKSRKLWNNGKHISWMHIVDLYKDHVDGNLYTHCPKLTQRHVNLDSHSRMNVNLASQVLSDTVAHAIEYLYGIETSETVQFIRIMNKFFDCLNTKNLYEGAHKLNENLSPYVSVNDKRLEWLENDFLSYLENWSMSVEQRPGNFTTNEKNQMKLSSQTLNGLQITVKSTVQLVKYFLSQGVPFVLTSVFNQDPLEQYFGHCRHVGGSQDNPTVNDVQNSVNRLRVIGSTALSVTGGNTKQKRKKLQVVCDEPLAKRKKN